MKKIIICDLDGTLADCSHRQHYVQGPDKKDWRSFFKHMDKDPVNEDLNDVLKALFRTYDVWFVSARPDNYRDKTVKWLEEQGWVVNDDTIRLIMRKQGDFRADTIVKKEILNDIWNTGVYVLMAFDDRTSVVNMWRENGVLCSQVAQHDF